MKLSDASAIKVGALAVSAIYCGSVLAWNSAPPPAWVNETFTNISGASTGFYTNATVMVAGVNVSGRRMNGGKGGLTFRIKGSIAFMGVSGGDTTPYCVVVDGKFYAATAPVAHQADKVTLATAANNVAWLQLFAGLPDEYHDVVVYAQNTDTGQGFPLVNTLVSVYGSNASVSPIGTAYITSSPSFPGVYAGVVGTPAGSHTYTPNDAYIPSSELWGHVSNGSVHFRGRFDELWVCTTQSHAHVSLDGGQFQTVNLRSTTYGTTNITCTLDSVNGSGGSGAKATLTVVGGRPTAVNVTSGGTGYVDGELVYLSTTTMLSASTTCIIGDGAVGTATVVGGVITGVTGIQDSWLSLGNASTANVWKKVVGIHGSLSSYKDVILTVGSQRTYNSVIEVSGVMLTGTGADMQAPSGTRRHLTIFGASQVETNDGFSALNDMTYAQVSQGGYAAHPIYTCCVGQSGATVAAANNATTGLPGIAPKIKYKDMLLLSIGSNSLTTGAAFKAEYATLIANAFAAGWQRVICRGISRAAGDAFYLDKNTQIELAVNEHKAANPTADVLYASIAGWGTWGSYDGLHPSNTGYATMAAYSQRDHAALFL